MAPVKVFLGIVGFEPECIEFFDRVEIYYGLFGLRETFACGH